jgi:hypothetical protein
MTRRYSQAQHLQNIAVSVFVAVAALIVFAALIAFMMTPERQ